MAVRQGLGNSMLYFFVVLIFACQFVTTSGLEDGCTPEHIHLSYGNTATEMVVTWETQKSCSTPEVHYGISSPFDLDLSAKGATQDLSGCGGENCSMNFLHKVLLKDLTPSSTVYYRPASAGPFYFNVPGHDESNPLRFIITSKSSQGGQDIMMKSFQKVIYQHPYSGVFMLNKPQELVCKLKENILTQMEELAEYLPLMVGADTESEDELCKQSVFPVPGHAQEKTPSRQRWYSVDIGLVHFIVYSPKVFLEKDPKQAKAMQAWMVQDLTKVNKKRSRTPWIVTIGSDPMYCQGDNGLRQTTRDCSRNDSLIRHGLEDVFYYFGVDLVLELQHGVYERTWPHYKQTATSKSYDQPASPVEVVLAEGLMMSEETPLSEESNNGTAVKVVQADWIAQRFMSSANSYGHLSVVNASHLLFEWRQSTSDKGEIVLDEFWLVQEQHGNFSLASLPHNVSHKINQTIIAMGGKPGTYDFIDTATPDISTVGEGWSKYSLWLGLGLVGVAIVLGLGVATIPGYLRRRRNNAGRRWREVDRQGGDGSGRFYSMASDSDTDENDHDFEIDMFERAPKSESKLLTSY